MPIPSTLDADLRHRFAFHPARTPERAAHHHAIREECYILVRVIANPVPDGPEREGALRKVEEAMMWANAGISRQ
jgi:hypothetical protein